MSGHITNEATVAKQNLFNSLHELLLELMYNDFNIIASFIISLIV